MSGESGTASNNAAKDTSSFSTSNRAASRKTRVYIFHEFIRSQYINDNNNDKRRPSLLRRGNDDVVLDCAGGKGDLSWLLCNVDNMNAICLDPRITPKNKHILKSIQYLRNHPEECKRRSVPGLPTFQPLAKLLQEEGESRLASKELCDFESPRHMRILVDDDLVQAVRYYRCNHQDKDESWDRYWQQALIRGREARTLGYKEEEDCDDSSAADHGEIVSAKEAIELVLAAKLVVGFHPDQATDAAIDLANELNINYCIVPCCVFPKEFPHRRLEQKDDGEEESKHVRSYAELIQYLQQKHAPSMQTAKLGFHFAESAKNLCLYSNDR